MKLAIIFPPLPFGWTPVAPPSLEYLAALTRRIEPDIDIQLVSVSSDPEAVETLECDLAAISILTPISLEGYKIADKLRQRGARVVFGNMHASAMPEEAKRHGDAVVIGEAESVWSEVIKDFRSGALKPFYHGQPLPLDDLPTPLYGMLKGKKRHQFRIVNTSRGCPFSCKFCSVTRFYGKRIRFRPIEDVLRDVEAIPEKMFICGDENIWWTGHINRATELFTALKGNRKRWMGFGSLAPVLSPDAPRMLKAARESGLLAVWAGWESLSDEGLEAYSAKAKVGKDREKAVKILKDHGIDVSLFYMLGARHDSIDDFYRSIEVAEKLGVSMHPSLVVPYPGTRLREEYEPYIYKEMGWEYYNGAYALFEHPTLAPETREEMFFKTSLKLLSLWNVLKHMKDIPVSSFPHAHILSIMSQIPVWYGMKLAYKKWKEKKDLLSELRGQRIRKISNPIKTQEVGL